MDTSIKNEWLLKLESGKYKKGKSLLRSVENNYCCLGVLCDFVEPDRWRLYDTDPGYNHRGHSGMPSNAVLDKAGLDKNAANVLASINDNTEDFSDIIKYIREEL